MSDALDLFSPYTPDTRRESYHALTHVGEKQRVVLDTIKRLGRPCSMKEVSRSSRLEINRVTPRVIELVELGLLKVSHVARDPDTNRNVKFYTTV